VSAKRVPALWLKVAPVQRAVVWQEAQVCGKPAVTWFGLVVLWKVVRWHPAHSVDVPAYRPPTWHCAQATGTWAPVRAKRVLAWLNVDGLQPVVV
jgi:hypothetical protein